MHVCTRCFFFCVGGFLFTAPCDVLCAGLSPLPDTRHCENVVRGPTDTSYWLIPGQALVGAFPGSLDFSAEEADLISLLSAGVTVFARSWRFIFVSKHSDCALQIFFSFFLALECSLQKEFHFAEEGPSSSPSASPRLGRRRMNSPRYTFSNYSKHASSLADYPLSFVEFPLKSAFFSCLPCMSLSLSLVVPVWNNVEMQKNLFFVCIVVHAHMHVCGVDLEYVHMRMFPPCRR